jgi:hypothetical protein
VTRMVTIHSPLGSEKGGKDNNIIMYLLTNDVCTNSIYST